MKTTNTSNTTDTRLNIRVTPEMRKQLKLKAVEENRDMSAIIRELILDYLSK